MSANDNFADRYIPWFPTLEQRHKCCEHCHCNHRPAGPPPGYEPPPAPYWFPYGTNTIQPRADVTYVW